MNNELQPWSYRDPEAALRARRGELVLQQRAAVGLLPRTISRVYAKRVARAAAGASLILGAGALVVAAVVTASTGRYTQRGLLTALLAATVAVAPVAYAAASLFARFLFRGRLLAESGLLATADVYADVERLERISVAARAAELGDRMERISVALPLIGLALIVPLALHGLFWAAFMRHGSSLGEYDDWIRISMVIVGHSHLLLAFLGWRLARRMRSTPIQRLPHAASGWAAWGLTIASSAIPGVVLLFVPVALVAVTGLFFIPASFSWMKARVADERALLETA
ncbi:MAG: hypothetical protein EXR72_18795 [Myxococcales bacterium]|nr:hypothetical protein [Myxococcales bacterium]